MIEIYRPMDVFKSINKFAKTGKRATVTMFDPWYNKGVGGERDDYLEFIESALDEMAKFSDHIYVWGFPEIVATFLPIIPDSHRLECWLTWYYKNNPSVIRGWRSSQQTCLHLRSENAVMYPEHFLNEAQLEKKRQGKLRYMPGPPSVLEAALNIGFVGRAEQTGHPAQKPEAVFDPLIRMVTVGGDLVFDPMCGSGTTGAVCKKLGRYAVLADENKDYVKITRDRIKSIGKPPKKTRNKSRGPSAQLDLVAAE